MTQFAVPVSEYMTQPVRGIGEHQSLADADRQLARYDISALPVFDSQQHAVGVVSRTDLLRAGRMRAVDGARTRVLSLPDAKVREVMHSTVEVVTAATPLWEAARRMVRQHYHRLFVAEDSRLLGVVSTQEFMRAVAEARIAAPISELASGGVVTVRASDPLRVAIDRMAAAHHSGLVVVEGDWPVGAFSQVEALSARDADPDTEVAEFMDMRVLSLPATMPAHLVAAQALATGVRRVLMVGTQGLDAIVTGSDFARFVARSHNG